MNTYRYDNLPEELSYDKELAWYLDSKNIQNQELIVETISYFETGPGKGIAPSTFLNFLVKQYDYLSENLNIGVSIVDYFNNLPLSPIQLHGLLGHIIKWFGGYPVNFMRREQQITMKAIEGLFLSYPGNTPEKEYSKGNADVRNLLHQYGHAFTNAIRNNIDVNTIFSGFEENNVSRNFYETFEELFAAALFNKAVGPFDNEEKRIIEQTKLNYEYNVWLTEHKDWEYSDKENYPQKLTKEFFLEFLKYQVKKKKELLKRKQDEINSWTVTTPEMPILATEDIIDKWQSPCTEFIEKIRPMMNELANKYAPNGEFPIIRSGSHLMDLLKNFYGPYHLLEIQLRVTCLEGGFTKETIEGHLRDINEFIISSENVSHNEAVNYFINLPFSKEPDKPEYIYYKLKNNLYSTSPLWMNALISNGVKYDSLTFENHWDFIELYSKLFFFKNYLISLKAENEEQKLFETSSSKHLDISPNIISVVSDNLRKIGNIFKNEDDFSIAVEVISKFFHCKEQPTNRISVKSKSKKILAFQLGEIWRQFDRGVINYEYLKFYTYAFSIFEKDQVDENNVFGNKLYKYSITMT